MESWQSRIERKREGWSVRLAEQDREEERRMECESWQSRIERKREGWSVKLPEQDREEERRMECKVTRAG